jgi:hypothetical protein
LVADIAVVTAATATTTPPASTATTTALTSFAAFTASVAATALIAALCFTSSCRGSAFGAGCRRSGSRLRLLTRLLLRPRRRFIARAVARMLLARLAIRAL